MQDFLYIRVSQRMGDAMPKIVGRKSAGHAVVVFFEQAMQISCPTIEALLNGNLEKLPMPG
jgi:hypothetical protein